jgi:hypothetical protein
VMSCCSGVTRSGSGTSVNRPGFARGRIV